MITLFLFSLALAALILMAIPVVFFAVALEACEHPSAREAPAAGTRPGFLTDGAGLKRA